MSEHTVTPTEHENEPGAGPGGGAAAASGSDEHGTSARRTARRPCDEQVKMAGQGSSAERAWEDGLLLDHASDVHGLDDPRRAQPYGAHEDATAVATGGGAPSPTGPNVDGVSTSAPGHDASATTSLRSIVAGSTPAGSTKVPAAVVYMQRPDGRVLALTRGGDFADWHLPGGKWEPVDGETGNVLVDGMIATGPNLRATAIRETVEETGVSLKSQALRRLVSYHTRSGRPVLAYMAQCPPWVPDDFPRYPAGQPAWVPREMLTLPWSSFAHECRQVFEAVDREVAGGV